MSFMMSTSYIVAVSLVLVVGCGSGKEDRDESWEKKPVPEEPPPPAKETPLPNGQEQDPELGTDQGGDSQPAGSGEQALNGNWASVCLPEPKPHGLVFSFDEGSGSWLHGYLYFRDNRCKDQYATKIFGGTFEKGEPDADNPELLAMSFHIESIKVVLFDDALVEEFNKQKTYGFGDWQKGQAKETVGRRDSDGQLVKGFSNYNFVKIGEKKIFLSEFTESPEERTKTLVLELFPQ